MAISEETLAAIAAKPDDPRAPIARHALNGHGKLREALARAVLAERQVRDLTLEIGRLRRALAEAQSR
jgi:hypothetical protein